MRDFDLVAIGSGPAGQRAAVQAAKLGKRAAVVERRRCVGGVCLDTGTIPSKTLREAVIAHALIAGHGERGPGARREERPSSAQLLAGIDRVVAREVEVIEDQLRRNDVTVLPGEAAFDEPHTLLLRSELGIRRITADHVVIAVGTEPAPTPGVKPDGEVILTTDDILRLPRLPRSLAVVGAGIVGIEYASIFSAVGVEVTLVERRDRALEFLDREIVDELIHQMRNRNVTLRFGETVESLAISTDLPRRAILNLESGKRIVADMVLFSAGRVAATGPLNLPAAPKGGAGVRTAVRGGGGPDRADANRSAAGGGGRVLTAVHYNGIIEHAMGADIARGRDPDAPTNLGDLLYTRGGKTPSEQEWVALVTAIAGGDQTALQALYDRTYRLVFTLSVRIVGNRESAEELTVDVFHEVWRRAPAYTPAGGSVLGWVMNLARSRAIDRLRFEQRKKRVAPAGVTAGPETAPLPHDTLDLAEQGRLLRSALAILTLDERQAIEAALFSGLTYVEVAARRKEPVGMVKTRIGSGLGKLRQALARTMGAR